MPIEKTVVATVALDLFPQAAIDDVSPVDEAAVDAVSIEDAHRPNDLTLLELFQNTTVILGVLGIAQTRIETIEEIESRLRGALNHIEKDRLIAAPDCGLGMLNHETVLAKLSHLTQAVERIG